VIGNGKDGKKYNSVVTNIHRMSRERERERESDEERKTLNLV